MTSCLHLAVVPSQGTPASKHPMKHPPLSAAFAVAALSLCATSPQAAADTRADGSPSPSPRRADGHRAPVDPGIPAYDPAPPLTGDLYIGGGFAFTVVDQWVAIFQRAHPSVRVHTAIWGSTAAFGELVEGVTQVCLLTREFMPFESDFLDMKADNRAKGPGRFGVAVATGGYTSDQPECVPSMVMLVNKDNPIRGLTLAQLDAIFSRTRKRGYKEVTTWGDLGLTGDWADKTIHVYHPRMPDGVPNFFRVYVMQYGEFKDTNQSLYDHPGILRTDRYAITMGNRGVGNAREQRDPNAKTVALAYTEAGPYTTGSFEDVLHRTYPLSRLIYLYAGTPPGSPIDPLAKEFIRVALSHEGQWEVARTTLMPLPASVVRESLATLEQNPAKGPGIGSTEKTRASIP